MCRRSGNPFGSNYEQDAVYLAAVLVKKSGFGFLEQE
jgi:hypothetical protein